MNPRQLVTPIARHMSRALATTALALGISATVLAPSAALAAPLRPGNGPSLRPDLVVVLSEPRVGSDGVATFTATVQNQGGFAAHWIYLTLAAEDGLVFLGTSGSQGLSCNNDAQSMTCFQDRDLAGGDTSSITIRARTEYEGQRAISAYVATTGDAAESNTQNNSAAVLVVALPRLR